MTSRRIFSRRAFILPFVLTCTFWNSTLAADDYSQYGASYLLENKRVEELFWALLETFGFVNEIDIVFNGSVKNSIVAIIVDDALLEDRINPAKIPEIREDINTFLEEKRFDGDVCFVSQLISPWTPSGAETSGDIDKLSMVTFVIGDSQRLSLDQQMSCLVAGIAVSFGYDEQEIADIFKSRVREIMASIVGGEIGFHPDLDSRLEQWKDDDLK